jgi:cytochrome c-type biogenesis protein CcmF
MASGNGIVYLGLLLALTGIATSYMHLKGWDERFIEYSRVVSILLFFTVTIAVVYLYYLFMSSDMSVMTVWQYSKEDDQAKYKFAGVLAGMAGSLLFWIWMIMIPWTIEEIRAMRRKVDQEVLDWTRIITLSVVAMFLYILALHKAFEETAPSLLESTPGGAGLSPLLQTDLMIIHPPVVFVAYGFLVIPFAAALAHMITGKKDWTLLSVDWARSGWLFLTAGIGIGGLWAYIVLGWGGYWGWDPIETSSLLPWMILTGFLHAQLMYKRKGHYPLLAPLLGVFSFILVVFATFATRAAGLWVSVHNFGSGDPNTDVWVRFSEMWEGSPTVRVYVWFMILSVMITAFLATRIYLRTQKKEEEERYFTLSELMDDDMLMFGTLVLIIVSTVITMLILMAGVNGLTAENFDTPVGLLAIVGIVVLMVCLMWRHLGKLRMAQLAGVTILASICAGLLVQDHFTVASTMPILVVAMIGTIYKAVKSFNPKRLLPSISLSAVHIVHLSVVLIIIGYVGSNYLQEEQSVSLEVDGTAKDYAGYSFKAIDYQVTTDSLWVEMEVWEGNTLLGTTRPGRISLPDPYTGENRIRSEVKVVGTLSEDIYLIFDKTSTVGASTIVDVVVTILPLMKVLWAGMWLMMIGIAVRALADGLLVRRRALRGVVADDGTDEMESDEDADDHEPPDEDEDADGDYVYEREEEEVEDEDGEGAEEEEAPKEDRDDAYYEDLLEQELKRI